MRPGLSRGASLRWALCTGLLLGCALSVKLTAIGTVGTVAVHQALVLGLVCADERWILLPVAFRQCYEAYTIYSFYRFLHGAPPQGPPPPRAAPRRSQR